MKLAQYNFRAGFTLIELLVVFSIAVILSGSGYVALTAYSKKQVLDQVVQDAKAAIDQAKFSASAKTKPTGCGSNILTGFQFVVCSPAFPCTGPQASYETVALCSPQTPSVVSKKLPTGISIASSTTCTTVAFNTLTGFGGAGCQVDFSGNGVVKTVRVDSAGNVSIL